jgi:hypothetical protein
VQIPDRPYRRFVLPPPPSSRPPLPFTPLILPNQPRLTAPGGFIPDNILYLSYFYTSTELPTRLSFFWVSSQLTNICSALLASALLHLRTPSIAGWRFLFGIEGLLTALLGILSFFYLPSSPTQTANRYWGNGAAWFSKHEEHIMVNRILRDDPGKGGMHNREALDLSMLKACLADWHLLPLYAIALSWQIPTVPMTAYLTLQLREIGFGTFSTNLLTIPAYLLFIAQLLFWTQVAERWGQRFLVGVVSQVWAFPILLLLEYLPADAGAWGRYILTVLLVGHPYVHAILVAAVSRNAGTVRTRTVASALYNMFVQASSIVGQNVSLGDYDQGHYFELCLDLGGWLGLVLMRYRSTATRTALSTGRETRS